MSTASRTTAPLLGVGAVLLLVVGNELTKIGGGSPALRASGDEYADSVGSFDFVVVGVYVVVAAWLAMAGFFRVVGERLRERPGGDSPARLITGGGVLAAAVGISGAAPLLAATVMAGDGDLRPETAKALLLMNAAVFVLGWLLVAVPLGASALAAMRLGVLGRGMGWIGVTVAAALAVGSLAVWWFDGVLLVWLAALIWIAVASVALMRQARRTARSADDTAGIGPRWTPAGAP